MKDFNFNPNLFEFTRNRSSTTQGDVEVYYAGIYVETFGDVIEMDDVGKWDGQPDNYFLKGAKRELAKKLYELANKISDSLD